MVRGRDCKLWTVQCWLALGRHTPAARARGADVLDVCHLRGVELACVYHMSSRVHSTLAVHVLSGVSESTQGKKVVIFKQSRHALTSGLAATRCWAMRFEKRAAWGNPLMGWVSSADTQSPVAMHTAFESAEAAIACAERNGWGYELQRDYTRVPGRIDAAYAYNFVPVAVQVRAEGWRVAWWPLTQVPVRRRALSPRRGGSHSSAVAPCRW